MFTNDVPNLRLILLGGEALQPSVVQRWSRPDRRIFNTYGPTEATVVATACEVRRGEPVTIGRPIPNYSCYVVGEDMSLVPSGVQGELLIGGPGVAQGYLQRPELTAEKFIANPFPSDGSDAILYRSGDAVSLDDQGAIVFHGRIDDQVKIRGFRVELGEIEVKLDELPGVAQAAVVLRNDDGLDRLVAFIVPEQGSGIDRMQVRVALAELLPSYMVPSRFELVETLPRLVSGKVDRKVLRGMPLATTADRTEEQEAARTETEAALLLAAQRVFPGQSLPFDADFFTELGGHSLIAARFVSAVRETPSLAGITLQDVYGSRSLRAMAALIDGRAPEGPFVPKDLSFTPPPLMRRFLCGLAQAAALPFILGLMTAQWLGVFVSYMLISGESSTGFWQDAGTLLGVYMAINVATLAIAVAGKWLILGRTKPGRYPLWGVYYYRWWLSQRLLGPHPHEVVPGHADHAAVPAVARRAGRGRRHHLRIRVRRDRPRVDRQRRMHRRQGEVRQCRGRGQRAHHRLHRYRRRRVYRHLLRHRARRRHRQGRRIGRSHRRGAGRPHRSLGNLGRLARQACRGCRPLQPRATSPSRAR